MSKYEARAALCVRIDFAAAQSEFEEEVRELALVQETCRLIV